jgi:predicted DsbA family dithiol-disulfide isomerase
VLADCAVEGGLPRQDVVDFLGGDLADKEMRAADQAAREAGVSGVPSFFLDGYSLFSGAMPAETIAEALRRGQAVLRQRQSA